MQVIEYVVNICCADNGSELSLFYNDEETMGTDCCYNLMSKMNTCQVFSYPYLPQIIEKCGIVTFNCITITEVITWWK